MSVNQQDGVLVACSCNNSFVGVWVIDLNGVKPFAGRTHAGQNIMESSGKSHALHYSDMTLHASQRSNLYCCVYPGSRRECELLHTHCIHTCKWIWAASSICVQYMCPVVQVLLIQAYFNTCCLQSCSSQPEQMRSRTLHLNQT